MCFEHLAYPTGMLLLHFVRVSVGDIASKMLVVLPNYLQTRSNHAR